MFICLERSAHLHIAQLMPLPLTVSCFSKIQIGFIVLVPAHLGSPGQRAVKRVCVCVHIDHQNMLSTWYEKGGRSERDKLDCRWSTMLTILLSSDAQLLQFIAEIIKLCLQQDSVEGSISNT